MEGGRHDVSGDGCAEVWMEGGRAVTVLHYGVVVGDAEDVSVSSFGGGVCTGDATGRLSWMGWR